MAVETKAVAGGALGVEMFFVVGGGRMEPGGENADPAESVVGNVLSAGSVFFSVVYFKEGLSFENIDVECFAGNLTFESFFRKCRGVDSRRHRNDFFRLVKGIFTVHVVRMQSDDLG